MVCMSFRVKGSNDCSRNGMRGPLRVQLSRSSQVLNARAVVATVQSSKEELDIEKVLYVRCLKVLSTSTALNVPDARLATVSSPAPYRKLLLLRDYGKSATGLFEMVRSVLSISSTCKTVD